MEEMTETVDLCGTQLEKQKGWPEPRGGSNRKSNIKAHYRGLRQERNTLGSNLLVSKMTF